MKKEWLLTLLLTGMLAMAAQADPTYYTSSADYDAATVGNVSYDFGSVASVTEGAVASPFVTGPLSFSADALKLYTDDDYFTGNAYLSSLGGGSEEAASEANSSAVKTGSPAAVSGATFMDISLAGASAVAFDLGTYSGADIISIEVNGTFDTTVTSADGHPTSEFFGVTSSVPITSLAFGIEGPEFDVLDFELVAVPEPSTVAMLGLAAMGFGAWTWRRRLGRPAALA